MANAATDEKRPTAFHEAGHAVMAWRLEVRVKKVTIVPDEDSRGHCHHAKVVAGNPEFDNSDRTRLSMEKAMQIALAGPIAQQLFNPRGWRRHHGAGDFQSVVDLAFRINGSEQAASAHIQWLKIRTKDALRCSWDLVKALANELLARNTLDGKQVTQILCDARTRAFNRAKRSLAVPTAESVLQTCGRVR